MEGREASRLGAPCKEGTRHVRRHRPPPRAGGPGHQDVGPVPLAALSRGDPASRRRPLPVVESVRCFQPKSPACSACSLAPVASRHDDPPALCPAAWIASAGARRGTCAPPPPPPRRHRCSAPAPRSRGPEPAAAAGRCGEHQPGGRCGRDRPGGRRRHGSATRGGSRGAPRLWARLSSKSSSWFSLSQPPANPPPTVGAPRQGGACGRGQAGRPLPRRGQGGLLGSKRRRRHTPG